MAAIVLAIFSFGLTYIFCLAHLPYDTSPCHMSLWVSFALMIVPMWACTIALAYVHIKYR